MRHNKNVSVLIDVGAPQIRGVLIYGAAETTGLRSESEVKAMALPLCEKYAKRKDQGSMACCLSSDD